MSGLISKTSHLMCELLRCSSVATSLSEKSIKNMQNMTQNPTCLDIYMAQFVAVIVIQHKRYKPCKRHNKSIDGSTYRSSFYIFIMVAIFLTINRAFITFLPVSEMTKILYFSLVRMFYFITITLKGQFTQK